MHCALCQLSVAPRTCDEGRRLVVGRWICRGGGEGWKGTKGWLDVRVEMTGRIERNGGRAKAKKETSMDRRGNGERRRWRETARMENSVCAHEWIVALLNARTRLWEKSAIVSLTHGVVSRHSPDFRKVSHRLFSRSSWSTSGPPLLPIQYMFYQHAKLLILKASCLRHFRHHVIVLLVLLMKDKSTKYKITLSLYVGSMLSHFFWKKIKKHISFNYSIYHMNLSTLVTSYFWHNK